MSKDQDMMHGYANIAVENAMEAMGLRVQRSGGGGPIGDDKKKKKQPKKEPTPDEQIALELAAELKAEGVTQQSLINQAMSNAGKSKTTPEKEHQLG